MGRHFPGTKWLVPTFVAVGDRGLAQRKWPNNKGADGHVRKWRAVFLGWCILAPMMLDHDECYRALSARDARHDGRFFICVHTTGIFCRPVCPARTPKRENVQFVETAEAAQQLGFRACKRCRPEVKAGSAAWDLTGASLRRALRLIDAGALDVESIDDFAARLGIGARHLRRLIKSSLGVAPNRLAVARRAVFARNLIESGSLSMTEVAAAAGFGSLRRFNDVMQQEFGTNPMSLRTQSGGASLVKETALTLRSKGVISWPSLYAFYAARAVPGMERCLDGQYARTLRTQGGTATVRISLVDSDTVGVGLVGANVGDLFGVVSRIRRALDLDTDVVTVAQALRADETLRPIVDRFATLRLPCAWDPFELSIRALLGQQISVKAARTLAGRIVARFGETLGNSAESLTHVFPRAETLAHVHENDLVTLGLTRARARAVVGLSKAAHTDPAFFSPARSLEVLLEKLLQLEGVGAWTAHYIALRAFGEADAFPAGDLGLRKAYGALSGTVPSGVEMERIAAKWSPWRGYAAQYLWTYLASIETKERSDELAA